MPNSFEEGKMFGRPLSSAAGKALTNPHYGADARRNPPAVISGPVLRVDLTFWIIRFRTSRSPALCVTP